MVADWDDALLPSLSAHFHLLRQEIDVHPVDSPQLAQPHSRRIEQLEYCRVPNVGKTSFLRLQPGGLEQQIDLRAVQVRRQILVLLRSVYSARGIRLYLLVTVQVLVEAANR